MECAMDPPPYASGGANEDDHWEYGRYDAFNPSGEVSASAYALERR